MREILFRGKRTDNGNWIDGHLIVYPKSKRTKIMVWEQADLEFNAIEVRPETVGQYTGLTDKNGTKIFEGDILRYVYEPGKGYWNCYQNGVVKWREPGWYMEGIKGTNKYALMSGYLSTIPYATIGNEQKNIQVFEVIGNIHDNLELLEVE